MNFMPNCYDFQVPDHIGRVIYQSFERFDALLTGCMVYIILSYALVSMY